MSQSSQPAGTAETSPDHPSQHQPDYARLAIHFCRLGASNTQLAALFDVPVETIHLWLANIADFADAVRRGRFAADVDVTNSLYRRGMGYDKVVQRLMVCRGEPMVVSYHKHYPPHVGAGMNWLCNRLPHQWSWHGKKDVAAEAPADLYARPLLAVAAETSVPDERHSPADEQDAPAQAAVVADDGETATEDESSIDVSDPPPAGRHVPLSDFMLLSPDRGRGWVRGLRTLLPPLLASPPFGGEEHEMEQAHRRQPRALEQCEIAAA